MRASKEACSRAQDDLGDIVRWAKVHKVPPSILGNLERIGQFLNVAKLKLPTEVAYERDKQRARRAVG